MKKKTLALIAALSVIAICTACGNKTPEKKDETTTAPASSTTTSASATAPETTDDPTDTTTPETEATADTAGSQDNSDRKELYKLVNGRMIYEDECIKEYEWDDGYTGYVPTAYLCPTKGLYHDSIGDPELFDLENFEYSGETAEYGEMFETKPGDTFGSLTVKDVRMGFSAGDSYGAMLMDNVVKFDGEITLTGIVRFYYDEQYGIISGDLVFFPDSSYSGMPMAANPANGEIYVSPDFDYNGFDDIRYDGPAVYTDAPRFLLGNVFENYADDAVINDVFEGCSKNITRKAEITLTDVELSWSDQFGVYYNHAKIKTIKTV